MLRFNVHQLDERYEFISLMRLIQNQILFVATVIHENPGFAALLGEKPHKTVEKPVENYT